MDYKDIEKELKSKADQMKLASFDERWENIKDRISDPDEVCVPVEEPVLVADNKTVNSGRKINKRLLIEILVPVFVVLALCAIILPQVLRKKEDGIRYFELSELSYIGATEEEFLSGIERSNLNTINFTKYEISEFRLLVTSDNVVLGGRVDVLDEADFFLVTVKFYSPVVKSEFVLETDSYTYQTNGFEIKYVTEFENDIYTTTAIAANSQIRYEMEFTTIDDNLTAKFDKLFAD